MTPTPAFRIIDGVFHGSPQETLNDATCTQLGSYETLSPIGKGGMGEVWRTRDQKLGREVAIKTLPEEFARDEDLEDQV